MKNLLLTALCTIGFVACDGNGSTNDTSPDTQTIALRRDGSGELAYCTNDTSAEESAQTCQTLPNPKGCETLIITVDTRTGQTCEVCAGADGQPISEGCGGRDAVVECEVIAIPDPDCVVCAYVNGTVIFSSCQPQETCANVACPAIARICPDGQIAEPDPNNCCGEICKPNNCEQIACAAMACAPGYRQTPPRPGACCGECVPDVCYSDSDCTDFTHCSVSDGACLPCNAPEGAACDAACRGTCVPNRWFCPDILVAGPDWCENGVRGSAGTDQYGCTRGELCYCADGSIAKDGNCP
jgi:hypothetical protein